MINRRMLFLTAVLVGWGLAVHADEPNLNLAMSKAIPRKAVGREVTETEPMITTQPLNDVAPASVDSPGVVMAPPNLTEEPCVVPNPQGYAIGIGDMLTINVVRPESLLMEVTVSPDGTISFPYIGTINVKGKTLNQVQDEMTKKLGEGYMKYPVMSVTLKESRSKRFFVYGEVAHPGPYSVEENMTVLRAISMAGGFSKFGSSSRVKVLRPRAMGRGYESVKINIKDVMDGHADADMVIKPGDIVVVSEGVF